MMAVLKTVLSGLVGIRRKADHDKVRVRPLQLIVAALVLVSAFIVTLITIVRIVTG